jgi:RNA polymerase sigma factor (TIGR02999 family)
MASDQDRSAEITRLLEEWSRGDEGAFEKLLPLVYNQLRRLAASYLRRERPNHTLQPTALVHEAYFRVRDMRDRVTWQNRFKFVGLYAQMMRRVLIDHAREYKSEKRGGKFKFLPFEEIVNPPPSPGLDPDIIEFNEVLKEFGELYPREAGVVELRFFGGLSIDETAEVLDISTATVERHWRFAKAWLRARLEERSEVDGRDDT